ncbi:hypothetical protein HFO26_14550 [Rhizobium leguminosarum]|uniref:hypothetical protein n=1 Tax=Rhizobium leguminosarum TaxID=384 RepID=UPI001C9563EF|nr:hypothetical protein [Rhizobium leguminosarum]MBY5731499.1 hypothetical protein [Rhizobium leguminosarum]
MTDPSAPVSASVLTERTANGSNPYQIAFDLERDLKIDIPGPFGSERIGYVESDLLDIAIAVHFLERDQRKKAETNRVRQIKARLPVRNPSFWSSRSAPLVELLRFMGGCDWAVDFVQSSAPVRGATKTLSSTAHTVVLNSGGMDSTCGLSGIVSEAKDVRLASFYTLNSRIQRSVAETLGFEEPARMRAVWRERSERRGNGALSYRSFLFLTFGMVVARSFGARRLLQFENGVMARAVTPAASYFTTRHAHPKTHRLFKEWLGSAGIDLEIENPFKDMTKGEEVDSCRRDVGAGANALLAETDSCWYFHYLRVPVRYAPGVIEKEPRRHCGVCVPCLVRRAAFGDKDYVFDPVQPPRLEAKGVTVDSRNFTYNLDALKQFSLIVSKTQNAPDFRRAMSRNGIDIDPESGTWEQLHALYGRFAREFLSQFG